MMVILEGLEAWVSGFGSVIEKWLEAILSEYFFLALKYFRKSSKIIKIEKKDQKEIFAKLFLEITTHFSRVELTWTITKILSTKAND